MNSAAPVTQGRLVPWLYCSELERSLAFYRDTLGFEVLGEQEDERSAYIEWGGVRIMLQERSSATLLEEPLEYPYGKGVHFLIETMDIDGLYRRVAGANERSIRVAPRNRWYRVGEGLEGHREVVVADPDGYLFRFYQRLEGLEEA
jgi:catechol 2,3-dioxygenase-like lactoylglutathione lyase family enzyme